MLSVPKRRFPSLVYFVIVWGGEVGRGTWGCVCREVPSRGLAQRCGAEETGPVGELPLLQAAIGSPWPHHLFFGFQWGGVLVVKAGAFRGLSQ